MPQRDRATTTGSGSAVSRVADHGTVPVCVDLAGCLTPGAGPTMSVKGDGLVAPTPTGSAALGHTNALLTHLTRGKHPISRVCRRVLQTRMRAGHVDVTPPGYARPQDVDRAAADVVVGVSGNLAHVYFAQLPGRLSYEEIQERFPGVIAGLVGLPGIGYVLTHSHDHGPLVLSRAGTHYLACADFGSLARFCRQRGLPLVETNGQVSTEPAGKGEAGDPLLHGGP